MTFFRHGASREGASRWVAGAQTWPRCCYVLLLLMPICGNVSRSSRDGFPKLWYAQWCNGWLQPGRCFYSVVVDSVIFVGVAIIVLGYISRPIAGQIMHLLVVHRHSHSSREDPLPLFRERNYLSPVRLDQHRTDAITTPWNHSGDLPPSIRFELLRNKPQALGRCRLPSCRVSSSPAAGLNSARQKWV